jgi:hypothetical protein
MIVHRNRLLLQLCVGAVLCQRHVLDPETQLRQRHGRVFGREGPLQHVFALSLLLSRQLHRRGHRLSLAFPVGLLTRRRLLALPLDRRIGARHRERSPAFRSHDGERRRR